MRDGAADAVMSGLEFGEPRSIQWEAAALIDGLLDESAAGFVAAGAVAESVEGRGECKGRKPACESGFEDAVAGDEHCFDDELRGAAPAVVRREARGAADAVVEVGALAPHESDRYGAEARTAAQPRSGTMSLLRENTGAVVLAVLILIEPLLILVGFWSASASALNSIVGFIQSSHPALGLVAYVALYTGLVVAAVPSSPLTFAAGFLFGAVRGVLVSLMASSFAAALCMVLTRYYGAQEIIRAWVERSFSASRVRLFDALLAQDTFRFVFFVRLSPAFPYGLSNYLFAITSAPLVPYLVASVLGILPGTLLLAASGSLADSLVLGRVRNAGPDGAGALKSANLALVVIGILASIAVFALISRATVRAFSEDIEDLERIDD